MPFSPALTRFFAPGPARRPRVARGDLALAALVLAVQAVSAAVLPTASTSRRPDLLGWALLAASAAVLVWRRRAPMACMAGMVVCVALYHGLGYLQQAPILSSVVALYALAVAGPPLRTFLLVPVVVGLMIAVMSSLGTPHMLAAVFQSAGWIVAVPVAGEVVRIHRNYVAAIMERAERAERTREEEAARRVAEERLRIARDLHDLLAHSITLIGVRTSVAAHILVADPDRLDRTAVAGALDAIAETCREARAELRTTLHILRADADANGPLPSLAGIPALTRTARSTGATITLTMPHPPPRGRGERREKPLPGGRPGKGDQAPEPAAPAAPGANPDIPPAVGAAAYRIVQESLTNAVRHSGTPTPRITVTLLRRDASLLLTVEDNGPGQSPARAEGYGIMGMRERARSVGGTLTAGPRRDGPGFAVTAELPFTAEAPTATVPPGPPRRTPHGEPDPAAPAGPRPRQENPV